MLARRDGQHPIAFGGQQGADRGGAVNEITTAARYAHNQSGGGSQFFLGLPECRIDAKSVDRLDGEKSQVCAVGRLKVGRDIGWSINEIVVNAARSLSMPLHKAESTAEDEYARSLRIAGMIELLKICRKLTECCKRL